MLKGTLRQISICAKKKQTWLCPLDAISGGVPDPENPVLDSAGNPRTMWIYTLASGVIPCSKYLLYRGHTGVLAEQQKC